MKNDKHTLRLMTRKTHQIVGSGDTLMIADQLFTLDSWEAHHEGETGGTLRVIAHGKHHSELRNSSDFGLIVRKV